MSSIQKLNIDYSNMLLLQEGSSFIQFKKASSTTFGLP